MSLLSLLTIMEGIVESLATGNDELIQTLSQWTKGYCDLDSSGICVTWCCYCGQINNKRHCLQVGVWMSRERLRGESRVELVNCWLRTRRRQVLSSRARPLSHINLSARDEAIYICHRVCD